MRLQVSTHGDLPPDSDFAIHFPQRFGDALNSPPLEVPLDERSIHEEVLAGTPCTLGPLRLESPDPWLASWPVCPVNIYNLPLRLPTESGVVRLSARLTGKPVTLRLTV